MSPTETPVRDAPTSPAAVPKPGRSRHAAPPAPGSRGRIVGVDAARGLALLGMMAVHSLEVSDAAGEPTWVGRIASGTAAALFAVLAGVGVAFMTGRRRVTGAGPTRRAAVALVARAAVVGLLGLTLGLVTDAEIAAVILPAYAVLFVLAVPLVLLPTGVLVGAAALGAGALPVLGHLLRAHLPPPRLDNPSLSWLLADPVGLVRELLVTGTYPALSWLPYLAVGLALGRAPLRSSRFAAGLAAGGAGLAAATSGLSTFLLGPGGGLAAITAVSGATGLDPVDVREILTSGADGTTPTSTWWWLAVDAPHTSTPLDLARTTGIALAVVGAMLWLDAVQHPALRTAVTTLRAPLAAAGAMTLTFYTLHVLFLNSPFDVFEPGPGYVVQVVAVLLLGLAWRATAGRGPLETLASAAGRRAARVTTPDRGSTPH